MAGRTSHIRVPVRQQESCGAVIERRGCPTHRGVARRTVRQRKRGPSGRMKRIRGLLPGCQMALRVTAIRRSNCQIVVIVNVAGGAGHIGMAVGEQEPRRTVIKSGVQPSVKRVARVTRGRKICGRVIGVRGFLKIGQVARRAGRRESHKLADRSILVA